MKYLSFVAISHDSGAFECVYVLHHNVATVRSLAKFTALAADVAQSLSLRRRYEEAKGSATRSY